jgi:glycosyltransferase involved in cell wall biosynthesis
MRIAQIAPLTEAVPPRLYGGTERVVSFLTEELVRLGHEVTLFASGDSVTAAELVAVYPRALRLEGRVRDPLAVHLLALEQVFRRAEDFDVLHFHLDYWPFPLFTRQATPFVSTLHGRLDLPELWPVYRTYPRAPLVSVSDAQRRPMPWANWAATIHHGIPETPLNPGEGSGTYSYLAFLGRIAPEKGVERAVEIAGRSGMPLKIAAKVDPVDRAYYVERVRPMMSLPHVEYVGEIDDVEKAAFLSGAAGLLFTGDWPEPFGLAMIEAMSCGTPVLAVDHGAVREVIEHGLTGFVVRDLEEAVGAVPDLGRLSRAAVRRRFEERFTVARMARDHLALYARLSASLPSHSLADGPWSRGSSALRTRDR